jgi:acetyl-CoA carboxylase biotin carboxyl carrier protein
VDKGMNDKNKQPAGPEEIAKSGKIDYDELRKLIGLLEEKGLSVFELEVEGLKIKIGRNAPQPAPSAIAPPAGPTSGPVAEAAAAAVALAIEVAKGHRMITSPMVGMFYRASDPSSPPFVDIGDVVKKGQTLCIIEAMKLMNEIEADVDGTVVEIYGENAKPVEYGQKLFAILPSS